jgi:hypothetical protein
MERNESRMDELKGWERTREGGKVYKYKKKDQRYQRDEFI